MLHKNIPLGDIHYIHNWEVANAAAMAALTVTEADKGKLAWKLDTNEFYFLANHIGPTWIGALGVGGPVGPTGPGILSGIVAPTTEGTEGDFYLNTVTSMIYGPKGPISWPTGVSLVGATGPQGPIGLTGNTGPTGATGSTGPIGANGLGVPAGGATGTILTKVSAADNDTTWAVATGAGTTVSATAPSSPSNGQGWFDTNTGITYTWVDDGDSSAWVEGGPVAPKPAGRELLSAARNYYVATAGSDSNDGLAVGTPFLTIQRAIDVVSSTVDLGIYNVTIQIADGTYTGANTLRSYVTAGGEITIKGNVTTPANVHINVTAGNAFGGTDAGRYTILDCKISTTTSGEGLFATGLTSISYGNINFGACAGSHIYATLGGASAKCLSSYTISGASPYHARSLQGAIIELYNVTVTITGSPTFSNSFVHASRLGNINSIGMVFSGACTGKRYNSDLNSVVHTYGGSASYYPGTVAGTVASQGLYA